MPHRSRMIEGFLSECPKCHAAQEWVRTEADRARLKERGETGEIGIYREITVSVNRRVFAVRCPCGETYIHRRVLGNEDMLANARLAKDYGAAPNPLTGMATPVVPRYEWKSIALRDFLMEVRAFWGRKDKEALRQGLAREGVHIAPFKEVEERVGEAPPATEEPEPEPPAPAPRASRVGARPTFPRP